MADFMTASSRRPAAAASERARIGVQVLRLIRGCVRHARSEKSRRVPRPCSTRSWSPTAARSPIRVFRALRGDGHRVASPSTPSSTATRCTSSAPTRPTCSAARTGGRELPEGRQDHRGLQGVRRRGRAPRLRLPGRERRLRARAATRPGSSSSARPPARSTRWARRPRARELMQEAGVPIVPGTTEVDRGRRRGAQGDRQGHRLPGRHQGRGRRRRQGLPRRAGGVRAREGLRGRQPRGREVLQRPARLHRALPARPAPRRGPDPRRPPRQRHPPRRARLLGPAPPPEGDRGVAGARRRRRSCARGSARSASTPPRPSTTSAPARSRACSRTASTSSWR